MACPGIWRAIVVGALALSVVTASPPPASACACAAGGPNIDLAFVGRVVAVVEGRWVQRRLRRNNRPFDSSVALVAVDNFRPGPWRPFYTVVGGTSDCAISFVPGATYLIYAQERGYGPLDTSVCLGTRQMDIAPE